MFRALSVRNYRLYFTGQVLSNTGTWMQRVAQDWLVLDLSGTSGVALGITTGLQFLPYRLFSLWGGTLADRFDRRRLIIWTQSVMGLLALGLGAVTLTGSATVHLVSPAGPLEPGDLEAMAGGPVFRLAQRTPGLFAAATALQGLLVRAAPGAVFQALFAGASGAEAALVADPRFRETVTGLMRRSYGPLRAGYVRDLRLYVRPWGEAFARLGAAPVVWQGSEDTWTPPAMARRIAALAPGSPRLTVLPGLAHYSTLFEAVPRILAEVGGSGRAA